MKAPTLPPILKITSGRIPPLVVGILVVCFLAIILTLIFWLEGALLSLSNYSRYIFMMATTGYVVFITRVIYNSHVKGLDKLLIVSSLKEEEKEIEEGDLENKEETVNS